MFRLVTAGMLGLAIAAPAPLAAHDIPNDVTIYCYLKPEGQRLRLLARVPFTALIDVDWPRRGPDLLDLQRAKPLLPDAATLWLGDNITVYEGERALAYPRIERVRASLFSDRSFESYEQALASLTGPPLDDSANVSVKGSFLDVLFDYRIESDGSRFSVEPRFGRLGIRTATVMRFILPDGGIRAFEVEGNPGLIRADPTRLQTAGRFLGLGLRQLRDALGNLLFLICLVIPFRQPWQVAVIAASYVAGHSITLLATFYNVAPDVLWFPPFIEAVSAASILYVALENLVGVNLQRRWMVAFGFGLVHGFGLAYGVRPSLQFAGRHVLTSLFSFDAGIGLGQMLILGALIPTLALVFRFVIAERLGIILLSALIAHAGWHWTIERVRLLSRYQFAWPELTPALVAIILRWLMAVVALAGMMWLINVIVRARRETAAGEVQPVARELESTASELESGV
jgi:hypothetical protein